MSPLRKSALMAAAAGLRPRMFATHAPFPGAANAHYTRVLSFDNPSKHIPRSVFHILPAVTASPSSSSSPDTDLNRSPLPLPKSYVMRLLTHMIRLRVLDATMNGAQRQGRIAFFITSRGEEAAVIGTTAALSATDPIFSQYREHGALLWRGADYRKITDQCIGNIRGHGRGHQMPMHYGSAALSFITVSSPLATQLPHAVGAAYATNRPVCAFLGDGAASEGDFAAALSFAGVLRAPVIFVCRNNGFAISTPTHEQYAGDGIVARARAAGVDGARVDGNDVFAVHEAVTKARARGRPILLELMTYRAGCHSTSDDSSRYRVDGFSDCPIERLRRVVMPRGWWDAEREEGFIEQERVRVVKALEASEAEEKMDRDSMFEDVYSTGWSRLDAQRAETDRVWG